MNKFEDFKKSFTFNEKFMEYRLQIKHERKNSVIAIDVDCLEENEINAEIELAFKFYENLDDWIIKARDFAMSELLESKNKAWLEKNAEKVSETEFISMMRLTSVSFLEDEFILNFDADDMFIDYAIVVEGNFEEGFRSCHI
ncbi:MAG: DUF2262 domain-containing protein [Promethearchaeota archaeon]